MALIIKCPHCEKTLSVPDEAVGKMVRCPACQSAFPIAQPPQEPDSAVGASAPPPLPAASPPAWDKDSPSTHRKRAEEATKQRKKRRYDGGNNRQEPDRKQKNKKDDQNPFALQDEDGRNRPLGRPHRGGIVLALGILSFIGGCFILSFITISMANVDLIQMAAKRMDSAGKTMTKTGKYLAMANLALTVLVFGLGFCVWLALFALK